MHWKESASFPKMMMTKQALQYCNKEKHLRKRNMVKVGFSKGQRYHCFQVVFLRSGSKVFFIVFNKVIQFFLFEPLSHVICQCIRQLFFISNVLQFIRSFSMNLSIFIPVR